MTIVMAIVMVIINHYHHNNDKRYSCFVRRVSFGYAENNQHTYHKSKRHSSLISLDLPTEATQLLEVWKCSHHMKLYRNHLLEKSKARDTSLEHPTL